MVFANNASIMRRPIDELMARIDLHAGDKHDAFHLAEPQRLNLLPTAHIYEAQLRIVRDLLWRRLSVLSKRRRKSFAGDSIVP
jgi:hypothetical protein